MKSSSDRIQLEYTREDFETVLRTDSSRRTADIVVKMVGTSSKNFKIILDISFEDKYPMSMRSSRAIQLVASLHPEMIDPYIDLIIDGLLRCKVDGLRRNVLKLLTDYFDVSKINDPGKLLEQCYSWLKDTREPIAVRVLSMNVLYNFTKVFPELAPELCWLIQSYLEGAPAAFSARARMLLKKMNFIIDN